MNKILIFISIFMIIRVEITSNKRKKIINAIYNYNVKCIVYKEFTDVIEYTEMESFERTILRLWDWGYSNIVPKDIYDKIKDYIED